MATIGVDCQIILDGQGYWIEPHSYQMHQPRIRKATITKGGGERYVDVGLGKRVWAFTVLCLNDQLRYDGASEATTGQQYRDALRTSYAQVATVLSFTDPNKVVASVHFDDYREQIRDVRTQLRSPGYLVHVELVEV